MTVLQNKLWLLRYHEYAARTAYEQARNARMISSNAKSIGETASVSLVSMLDERAANASRRAREIRFQLIGNGETET